MKLPGIKEVQFKFSFELFRHWVDDYYYPGEIISPEGYGTHNCPLALYARSLLSNSPKLHVHCLGQRILWTQEHPRLTAQETKCSFKPPDWVIEFDKKLEASHNKIYPRKAVTREQILELLDSL